MSEGPDMGSPYMWGGLLGLVLLWLVFVAEEFLQEVFLFCRLGGLLRVVGRERNGCALRDAGLG